MGTAFSVGAKTGWSFYAKEGFSKGKEESEQRSYENSHLDSEHITLSSGKDTTLKGAVAKAETIEADVKGNLTIESLQDSQRSNSNSLGLGSKVEFGFGTAWEFSGNASATSGKANSKQVTEQSGLFAGEGGYHINANNVHLEGGAIASTNPSQSELSTNTLTFKDIQNESGYQAVSGSLSAGTQTADGKTTPNVGAGMPMYDGDKDNATTKATLTEGNITLNKDSQPMQTTAKALGINTELDKANEQVETPKDINKVLKEQQVYSQSIGNMMGAANTFASQKAEEAKAEAEKAKAELEQARARGDVAKIEEKETAYTQAKAHQESWESGGSTKRKLDTAVAVLGTILAGKPIADTAVAAISPELNAQIHEQTKDNERANLFAHAVLSAVEFYATGKDPLAGAVAGVAGEGAAMLAGNVLGKSPSQLTEEERDMLKTAAQLAGAIAGGMAGNSTATTVAGLETEKRAVENNYLFKNEAARKYELEQKAREGIITPAEQQELAEINKLDEARDVKLLSSCVDKMSSVCREESKQVDAAKVSYSGSELSYAYAYPVYTAYSTKYEGDYKKAASFSEQYSILTASKEKAYADFEARFDLPKGSVNQVTQWGDVIANTAGLIGTSNVGKSALSGDFSKSVPKEVNSGSRLPVFGETPHYDLTDFKANVGRTLIYHENIGGHTITRHVGKTEAELINRLNLEPNLRMASSFTDIQTAEKAISMIVYKNTQEFSKFMASDKHKLVITGDAGFNVGKVVNRQNLSSDTSSKATVVIIKDPIEYRGWRVLTAFPDK